MASMYKIHNYKVQGKVTLWSQEKQIRKQYKDIEQHITLLRFLLDTGRYRGGRGGNNRHGTTVRGWERRSATPDLRLRRVGAVAALKSNKEDIR